MTFQQQIQDFFSEEGPLAERLVGYIPRETQINMAQLVAKVLQQPKGRLVIEAGTGTGKSLAYLIAALLSDKSVMISTATRALQDQLFQKDLPLVLDALYAFSGKRKYPVLMKGRANYLCLLRAERFQPNLDLLDSKHNQSLEEIRIWMRETQTGDRAELPFLADDSPLWAEINARTETCLGQDCPLYNDCYVTQMRRQAEMAHVVVVNHALFCAERTLRVTLETNKGVQILPQTDHWIFDEAHALEDVATRHFGVSISQFQIRLLVKDLLKAKELLSPSDQASFAGPADGLQSNFGFIVDKICPPSQSEGRSLPFPAILTPEIKEAIKDLQEDIRTLESTLLSADGKGATEKGMLAALYRRVQSLGVNLNFLFEVGARSAGYVTFIERDKRGGVLTASPIDVAAILQKTLWSSENAIVLTSATLAVKEDLSPFLRRIGLEETVEKAIWPAPFDFENRAGLFLPQLPDPASPLYTKAFCEEAEFLVQLSHGGAFLLFTSYRALEASYKQLKKRFEDQGLLVLKQGDMPKLELLRLFKEADDNKGGALFATHSFWEGVDVRGKALRMVIIDRLPFKSPDDPIYKARTEAVEKKGLSSFAHISLPEAALALKQGVGRLLRTLSDAGIVAVLDSRITQKSYGQVFLKTLPPLKRLYTRAEVELFWREKVLKTWEYD